MEIDVTKRQWAFITAQADEVLFGGAAGGGKSYGQLVDAFLFAMHYPGSKQLLLRRTLTELDKSLVRTALGLYPAKVFRYRKSEHSGVFTGGSVLDFGYCDNETDVYKYQSAEYDVIRFDELTHFTESMYVYLLSRIRGANDFPKQAKSSTNPGGVGHAWVKKRFVDIGAPNKVHECTGGSRIFLPSFVQDNHFLMKSDPSYLKRLKNLDARDQRALLHGDWDLFEGQFFSEWNRKIHVVDPFVPPDEWRRYFVMDYGMDMLAAYLIAVDPYRNCYVYRELYEGKDNGKEGLIVSVAAQKIREMVGTDPITAWYAPPDLWSRQKDSGQSLAALFSKNGVPICKVSNNRVAGWMSLKELLRPVQTEDGSIRPRLRIFSNCVNLIRCLPALAFRKDNPNDTATIPHEITHAPDALRYFAVAGAARARAIQEKKTYHFSEEKPKQNPYGMGERIKVI